MSAAPAPAKAAAKKPRAKPAHPPVSTLIVQAIVALKERMGSSVPAIKKWIGANNKVRALCLL